MLNRIVVRRLVVAFLALLLIFAAYQLYLSRQFHIVSTDPKLNNVASVSPFLKVNFNRQLSSKGLSVTSTPDVVSSYSVSGKVLDLSLKQPMDVSSSYTITINIADIAGARLSDQKLVFKPLLVPYGDLSKEQQSAILKSQTTPPATKSKLSFIGFDALTNYGITVAQLNDLEKAVYTFAPAAAAASIDQNSIKPVPHNPNSSSTYDSINFVLTIDSNTYTARADYTALTTLRLYLYNSRGSLIFDSKDIKS